MTQYAHRCRNYKNSVEICDRPSHPKRFPCTTIQILRPANHPDDVYFTTRYNKKYYLWVGAINDADTLRMSFDEFVSMVSELKDFTNNEDMDRYCRERLKIEKIEESIAGYVKIQLEDVPCLEKMIRYKI